MTYNYEFRNAYDFLNFMDWADPVREWLTEAFRNPTDYVLVDKQTEETYIVIGCEAGLALCPCNDLDSLKAYGEHFQTYDIIPIDEAIEMVEDDDPAILNGDPKEYYRAQLKLTASEEKILDLRGQMEE